VKLPGKLIRGPVRPDRDSLARFASLRWAALPIIDRRWTAPMAAAALGFGLFVGVAIGPGTQGTEGAAGALTVQVPEEPAQPEAPPAHTGGDAGSGAGQGTQDGSGGDGQPSVPSSPPPIPSSPPPISAPPVTTPPISPTVPPVSTGGVGTSTTSTTTTPAEEPTTELSGTVVHINPYADSYTIAADGGNLTAIHSHHPPNLGKSIEVDAKQLANGTYVEAGDRSENGSGGQASFNGTVSFSDRNTAVYAVSAAGVSLLVRGPAGHLPRLGDNVEVRARITDDPEPLPIRAPGEQGCGTAPALPKPPGKSLEQVSLRIVEGEGASGTDVEGIVEGVCRDDGKLIVSADDLRESGRDISLAVPGDIELGRIDPGDVLRLTTEIRDNGSLEVSTVAGDKGGKGADDPDLVQP
jgi:hypothetical protein